jgi:hypothetical protein
MRRRILLIAGLATLAFSTGCDPSCTLIGCVNGLHIDFDRPVTFPYRVELNVTPDSPTVTLDCQSANVMGCTATSAFLRDYLPPVATMKLTTPDGTVTTVIDPEYQDTHPNGRRCGPTCSSGRVTVTPP